MFSVTRWLQYAESEGNTAKTERLLVQIRRWGFLFLTMLIFFRIGFEPALVHAVTSLRFVRQFFYKKNNPALGIFISYDVNFFLE
jgi:hypothetical protein